MRLRSRGACIVLPLILALAGCAGSDPNGDGATSAAPEPADAAAADGDQGDGDQVTDEAGCVDGLGELDGVEVRSFECGTATASVTTPSGTAMLTGGTCELRDDAFAFNLGTVVLDTAAILDGTAPAVDYLGIAVHEGADGDGTYDDHQMVTVTATLGGEDLGDGTGTVTLRDGRTAGDAVTDDLTVEFECG